MLQQKMKGHSPEGKRYIYKLGADAQTNRVPEIVILELKEKHSQEM